MRTLALCSTVVACERPTAPITHAAAPVNIPTVSVRDVVDIGDALTDAHLAADGLAGCARGPLIRPGQARNPETRIVATRLRDRSLVRFRGVLDTAGVATGWFELVRDWGSGRGIRIGQVVAGTDEFWVLRYGSGPRERVTDERIVRDDALSERFDRFRREYAALECPRSLHRQIDYGTLLATWDWRQPGFDWRESWPPRPVRRFGEHPPVTLPRRTLLPTVDVATGKNSQSRRAAGTQVVVFASTPSGHAYHAPPRLSPPPRPRLDRRGDGRAVAAIAGLPQHQPIVVP